MAQKKKVMILHNMATPYRLPLFEELSKKHNLTVYFCKLKSDDRKWPTNLKDYSFKYKILPHKDIGPFVINPTINEELKKESYDAYILAENPENMSSIFKAISFAKKRNKKIIIWTERITESIHTYKLLEISKSLIEQKLYSIIKLFFKIYWKKVFSNRDAYISFSNSGANFLEKQRVNPKNIFKALQIMPESLLSKPRIKSKPKKFKGKKVILYVGYLNSGKGINYLINSFNSLNRKDAVLIIVGSGESEDELKSLAKKNKNILFEGYKEGAEKANYYSIADFFVFPTLYDCWGMVVNESFYYGVPAISTDQAGAKELIDEGKTGFIIPSGDEESLKKAIKRILDNPRLISKMKQNVKKIQKSRIVEINAAVKTFENAIENAGEST